MGKKILKNQNKNLVVDIIDILAELDPSTTNKFLPFLIKTFKDDLGKLKGTILTEIEYFIGTNNLSALKEFNDHLENGRTEIKDISQLKSFNDIHEELINIEFKLSKNKLKKQIKVLYKDLDWIIVKPLSYESSKIYGAGTKWCTSSREEDKPFYTYSNGGVLLYVIKLNCTEKYGVHWYLEKGKPSEMSWWDVEDNKVDSLTLNLPQKIKEIILTHYLENDVTNSSYFVGKDKERCEEISKRDDKIWPINLNEYIDPNEAGPRNVNLPFSPPEPIWRLYNGDNTTTTLNSDDVINKSIEYAYISEALKKSLEDLDN